MKRIIICGFAGAVVAQIWGMISWMALPWHNVDFRQFTDVTQVAEVLKSASQGTGLYTLPNMDDSVHESEAAMQEWNAQARSGPFAFIALRPDGIQPGMAVPMAIGFVINFVTAIILMWLLNKTAMSNIGSQVLFLAVAGSVGALYPHLSNLNWWHFPATYCIVGIIDLFITWGLAGFVMVKVARSSHIFPASQ